MSPKPDDIPQDVWDAAVLCGAGILLPSGVVKIAHAINGERERCAATAELLMVTDDGAIYTTAKNIAAAIRRARLPIEKAAPPVIEGKD